MEGGFLSLAARKEKPKRVAKELLLAGDLDDAFHERFCQVRGKNIGSDEGELTEKTRKLRKVDRRIGLQQEGSGFSSECLFAFYRFPRHS